ncbi:MAG: WecB/TagA/CpsF family glycosyltransferase [Flavobacteriales bacterium]|nr:WecB/TagA/CpsF family glycosyltransferase [Flavobacteriales bacterium]MCB9166049.1 WecB/TagA/CpsF family glycosyltransferase [Flavobacteriales bacterium]
MRSVAERSTKQRSIGLDISLGTFQEHLDRILTLGETHTSSYVCCVNAHMTVEAHRDPRFAAVVNGADMATADGMPVLYTLRWLHGQRQERVAGNDLMPAVLQASAERGLRIFLYGGRQEVLDKIRVRVEKELPGMQFAGCYAPPFLPLEEMDLVRDAAMIEASGAHIVLVSLGCPKQERWMAAMSGRVHGVMLGLGGAFLLYAGVDTRAPRWMRDLSLEWAYRLALEPGRLWKRYLVTNSLFLGLMFREAARKLFA